MLDQYKGYTMNTLEKAAHEAAEKLRAADANRNSEQAKKNPKINWNHDGKTMYQCLGYTDSKVFMDTVRGSDNDSNLKFAVLLMNFMQSPEGAVAGMITQAYTGDEKLKPSHIAEKALTITGQKRELMEVALMMVSTSQNNQVESLLSALKDL